MDDLYLSRNEFIYNPDAWIFPKPEHNPLENILYREHNYYNKITILALGTT